jgi:hypothetical protein
VKEKTESATKYAQAIARMRASGLTVTDTTKEGGCMGITGVHTPMGNRTDVKKENRESDNVGGVNDFLSTPLHALEKERHFALVDKLCATNPGSLVIYFRSGNSVRPMHLFDHNLDHDYYFELPGEEERDPQSVTRCSSAHHRDLRSLPRSMPATRESRRLLS